MDKVSNVITELYAFVSVDIDDGNEGIIAARTGEHWMPLIGADMNRVESLKPIAQNISMATGQKIILKKFKFVEEIEIWKQYKSVSPSPARCLRKKAL
jgi:hypothetical protein